MKYFKTEVCTILGCNLFKTDGVKWWAYVDYPFHLSGNPHCTWYPITRHPVEYLKDDLKYGLIQLPRPPDGPLFKPITEAEAFVEIL